MVSPCPLSSHLQLPCVHLWASYVCVCVHVWLPVGPDAGVCTVCKSGASWVAQAWPGLCRALSSECLQQCFPPQLWPVSLTNKDLGHLDPPASPRDFVNVAGSHRFQWSVGAEIKMFTWSSFLVLLILCIYIPSTTRSYKEAHILLIVILNSIMFAEHWPQKVQNMWFDPQFFFFLFK